MEYNINMNRKANSDFETVADIIKTLEFKYDADYETKKQELFSQWEIFVGEKLAKYSYPKELTDDGVMLIFCKNSVVANELFNMRIQINELIKKKAKKIGQITFKYIKITYK